MLMFACMPVDCASGLGACLGRVIGPRLGLSRRALANLNRAMPENHDLRNREILRAMWGNLGRTVAEFPHLARICDEGAHRVEIINAESLGALVAVGDPVLLFGCHLANWEVGSTVIHRLMGPSLLSVYRAANNPYVNWLLRRVLGSRRAVAKGPDGGRDLVRHLRQGGHVGMLVDQKLNDGIAVPFFGSDAMTAPAIARLALRFHSPIVPVLIERLAGARFRFTVFPALRAGDTGDAAADVLGVMTRINGVIEVLDPRAAGAVAVDSPALGRGRARRRRQHDRELAMIAEREMPEHSARHILRLIVGHFHATPGRVLREASLKRIFSSDGWDICAFQPGRDYAVEHGWLDGASDHKLSLTPAGYSAAFAASPPHDPFIKRIALT